MRIASSGAVGIGINNPARLFVVSNGGANGLEITPVSSGTIMEVISYNRSTSAYTPLQFESSVYNFNRGNVLIGTTSDIGYKLYVNGASFLNGYNYASSIQYTRAVSNTVNPAGGEGVLIFSGGQSAIRMNSAYTMNFDMYNGGNQFTALQIRQTGNAVSVNSPDNQLSLEIAYQGSGHGYLGATASYGRALLAYSQNGGYVYLSSSSLRLATAKPEKAFNGFTSSVRTSYFELSYRSIFTP
jgi:hypothetical protein